MLSLNVAELFGVKGRIALVTGGSSGVGLMIAKVKGLTSVTSVKANSLGTGTGVQWIKGICDCTADR